jgi:DNA primase
LLDLDKILETSYQNIEYVLERLDIEYRYENEWITMKCLFHDGDNFNLKFRDNSLYCFSQCRRQYSIIDVVAKSLVCSFYEAAKWLCDLFDIDANVDDDLPTVESKENLNTLKTLSKLKRKNRNNEYQVVDQSVLNTIEDFYHPWLEQEGLTKEACSHFGIGYARAGVLEGRICFPITSPDGAIISVNGRMPDHDMVDVERYHIIGNTQVKQTLYNLSNIKNDLHLYDKIYVVEGLKSVVRMYQEGYENVVSAINASLSDKQRNLLIGTGLDIVVICDNDYPGENFGQAVYNKCHKMTNVEVIKLSEITDKEKASVDDLTDEEFNKLKEVL